MFSTRLRRKRALIIFIISAIIFTIIASLACIKMNITMRKEELKKTIEERVEEIRSFYTTKYKADVIITDMNFNHMSNIRLYKDTTRLGFYIEEEPAFTLEIGVAGRNIEPFEVMVFPDKMIEIHK